MVQVDQTILNNRCKSHRGRIPHNKTDALYIFELRDDILRHIQKLFPIKKAQHFFEVFVRM